MGVLDGVKSLREQAKNSMRPGGQNFFSTVPGMLTALAAFLTASVSLFNSCTSANKAVLERMDKVAAICESETKLEATARENQVRELLDKNQALRDDNQKTRELAFEYYRKLETRVYDLEPGPGLQVRKKK